MVSLELQIWVKKIDGAYEKAAEIKLNDMEIGFKLRKVESLAINIEFERIMFFSSDVISSNFGTISAVNLRKQLGKGYKFLQPSLNEWL